MSTAIIPQTNAVMTEGKHGSRCEERMPSCFFLAARRVFLVQLIAANAHGVRPDWAAGWRGSIFTRKKHTTCKVCSVNGTAYEDMLIERGTGQSG